MRKSSIIATKDEFCGQYGYLNDLANTAHRVFYGKSEDVDSTFTDQQYIEVAKHIGLMSPVNKQEQQRQCPGCANAVAVRVQIAARHLFLKNQYPTLPHQEIVQMRMMPNFFEQQFDAFAQTPEYAYAEDIRKLLHKKRRAK